MLELLEHDAAATAGALDWTTKRFLLESTDATDWAQRKKIDIRYHELSSDGYLARLNTTGMVKTLTDVEEIDTAIRIAPTHSPATTRGRYIREFADGEEPLSVNWRRVLIGRGRGKRVVELRYFRRHGHSGDPGKHNATRSC
jgi:proteasome accessory factor A